MKKKIRYISILALSAIALGSLASCGEDENKDGGENSNVNTNTKYVYVSPDGNSNSDGRDESNPTTFTHAHQNAKPGDVIYLSQGTYKFNRRQELGVRANEYDTDVVTGTYDNYITIMSNPNNTEKVLFDFSEMRFADSNRGIQIYSNYWYIKDIEVYGAGDNGMYIAGSHNIIENCLFYGNRDTGLQLGRAYNTNTTVDSWPTCNLIKNCTSYANYDYGTFGENADGFAAKLTVGYGNIFDGCIASRNSDDGWDLFAKVDSGDIGTVIIYNCVSYENGFLPFKHLKEGQDTTKPTSELVKTYDTLNGDGIGFKLGGSTMRGNVIVENTMTFDNKLHGIGDNSNPGVLQVSNLTAFNNCSGVNDDGSISSKRGIEGVTNKSNNIDLARSIESYNSYYGILSYVNNQKNFTTANESTYNKDAFRGSTAYSIFNTGYNGKEEYRSFTGWEDASSYRTASEDLAFSDGVKFERGLSDSDFKELTSINSMLDLDIDGTRFDIDYEKTIANSEFRDELAVGITKMHNDLRNDDHSVNMGDHLALAAEDLKTYADGNPVGAVLNKSNWTDYSHYDLIDFYNNDYGTLTDDDIAVESALSICEAITRYDATYQDFKLPKLLHNTDISWKSSNPDVIKIENSEEYSVSWSAFSWARIIVPENETKVTLTATAESGKSKKSKQIEITVKGRNQTLGDLMSSGSDVIRVNLYGSFIAPRIYPTDNSSIVVSELPASLYNLTYTIKYATSGKDKFYTLATDVTNVKENIYTSVPGVYEVTATAALKSNPESKSSYTYKVYVVDPDCDIDFNGDSTVTLSQNGFVVTGNLSNIEGNVIAVYSKDKIENVTTAADLLTRADVQYSRITTDSIVAEFEADNESIYNSDTQYYIYYSVVNANESNLDNKVYTATINVKNIDSEQAFYNLVKTGKYNNEGLNVTTIYSLTKDLDFSNFNYEITATAAEFKGLFRGNNHTISNISIDTTNDKTLAKTVNVITKVSNGTIMDVKFDNISIHGNVEASKQVGIIGELQGGYIYGVTATRIDASGKEAIGGIIGQITGGINYVSHCALVNPYDDYRQYVYTNDKGESGFDINGATGEAGRKAYVESLDYVITSVNKYAGGIIGNAQKNSDQSLFQLYVDNCYVDAIIGDGNDGQGNNGLIIGRIKNDDVIYYSDIRNCVAYGLIISTGQYNGGIVGDFDNGSGQVVILRNISEADFMYQNIYLGAENSILHGKIDNYAHKNTNSIVGRATTNPLGSYTAYSNYGLWGEYYNKLIFSTSMVYDEWDSNFNCPLNLPNLLLVNMGFDLTNDWEYEAAEYDDPVNPTVLLSRYKLYLKSVKDYYNEN